MLELSSIRDTVMNVAEAITAALEIETEIISENLEIIGGTGRYTKKIGTFEEDGDLDSGCIYGKLLKSGKNYICTNPEEDLEYDPQEEEMAEIACPIKMDGKVVGLIGLVAFTLEQKQKIVDNSATLMLFLERMAELIASKLSETEKRNQLEVIFESMHEGLIAIDRNGIIQSCNYKCETLLGIERSELKGKLLDEVWDITDMATEINEGITVRDKEIIFKGKTGFKEKMSRERRFLYSMIPLHGGKEPMPATGAMILFRDISDTRELVYNMTLSNKHTTFEDIIGESEQIHKAKNRMLQVASSDSTVMIYGESGTGKELFARAIHSSSLRRDRPFVAINCGAIPEMLLESELFGYEKGAFTGADTKGKLGKFELAHKGTIFLDEIGDLPLHLQVKLLHVIQNRQVDRVGGISPIKIDVRIVAATNKNLEEMVANGAFREDLFFRLNVIPLTIPPLRERIGDIRLLLEYALKKFNRLLNKDILSFELRALEALLQYGWPGNVRELENVVEYAVNMETSREIRYENLPEKIQLRKRGGRNDQAGFKAKLDAYQKKLIEECLDETGYSTEDKITAARILGISESTLYRRIRELGIKEKE